MSASKTPETDAVAFAGPYIAVMGEAQSYELVEANFARKLETERDEAKAELLASQARELALREALRRAFILISTEFTFRRHSDVWRCVNGIAIHDEVKEALSAPPPDVVTKEKHISDDKKRSAFLRSQLAEAKRLLEMVAGHRIMEACWRSKVQELEDELSEHMEPPVKDSLTPGETFEAHGRTWTRHTPGDAMPCGSEEIIVPLFRNKKTGQPERAENYLWGKLVSTGYQIIGWCYAEKEEG